VKAVGTNHEVAVLGAPVGQADRHPLCILGDTDAPRPKPDDLPVEGVHQDRLEESAVDHDHWRVDAGRDLLPRACSQCSPSRAAERRTGRDRARVLDGRPDLQPPQRPHRVRPQQDTGADLAQLGCLFEDHNLESGSGKGDGCAQPTDAGADDDDLPRPGQGSHLLKAVSGVRSDATRGAGGSNRQGRRSSGDQFERG
jgi:hypothetical protein